MSLLLKMFRQHIVFVLCLLIISSCVSQREKSSTNTFFVRASQTLDSLYKHYSIENTCLLRENYPSDFKEYKATYLISEDQVQSSHLYSYLWPYSGVFSSVNALMKASKYNSKLFNKYYNVLKKNVLPGLSEYFDETRQPNAYASYINGEHLSDRFYDDNIWLGIDFIEAFIMTDNNDYLQKAKMIWKFVESGMDNKLGGGVYWCEQAKMSKNTCSNAPASVLALKLFNVTGDSVFFKKALSLYRWTKAVLQDTIDCLYYDNVRLNGSLDRTKYAYNSGQMIQASVMLYQLTGYDKYLKEARQIASSCVEYFFMNFAPNSGNSFQMIKKSDVWFVAVMLRGFIELFRVDGNRFYLDYFIQSIDYAWNHARDENGLFSVDFTGKTLDKRKWLLTQAAMVEMYANLSELYN